MSDYKEKEIDVPKNASLAEYARCNNIPNWQELYTHAKFREFFALLLQDKGFQAKEVITPGFSNVTWYHDDPHLMHKFLLKDKAPVPCEHGAERYGLSITTQ